MNEIGYHVLTIFGGLILTAFSVVGTVGFEQGGLYQSVLLAVGLVVMVTVTFHLGILWERRDETDPS